MLKIPHNIQRAFAIIILTVLSCVLARIFIYVPASGGLFNMGEPLIFLSALFFGPYIGAFVGGVGFMLADLLLGYPHYALATLIVKASAGVAIGASKQHKPKLNSKCEKIITLISGFVTTLLLGFIGTSFYSGEAILGYIKTLYAGEEILKYGGLSFLSLSIPTWFWIFSAIAVALYMFCASFMMNHNLGWTVTSMLNGVFIIVLGYFLYEHVLMPSFFNVKVNAIANMYVNLGQAIIGATLALLINEIITALSPRGLRGTNLQCARFVYDQQYLKVFNPLRDTVKFNFVFE